MTERTKTVHALASDVVQPSKSFPPEHVFPFIGSNRGVLTRSDREVVIDLARKASCSVVAIVDEILNND